MFISQSILPHEKIRIPHSYPGSRAKKDYKLQNGLKTISERFLTVQFISLFVEDYWSGGCSKFS